MNLNYKVYFSEKKVLYLKEVDTNVALVCLSRADNFRKKSLINYNITCLKKALRELIRPSAEKPR
jgi:Ras-related GTP-binding protein C/D